MAFIILETQTIFVTYISTYSAKTGTAKFSVTLGLCESFCHHEVAQNESLPLSNCSSTIPWPFLQFSNLSFPQVFQILHSWCGNVQRVPRNWQKAGSVYHTDRELVIVDRDSMAGSVARQSMPETMSTVLQSTTAYQLQCSHTEVTIQQWPLTLREHIKTAQQRTIIQQYGDWYTGRWWVGCYIWYSEEGPGRAGAPPSPLLTVPNVTAHPSTTSVPTSYYSMYHYNCLWSLKG